MSFELNMADIKNNFRSILLEQDRNKRTINLTANENAISKAASYFLSSDFSSRYYVGSSYQDSTKDDIIRMMNGFMFRTFPSICELEERAASCMEKMFKVNYCDSKPLSGLNAVFCILSSMTKPGDRVYVFTAQTVGHHGTAPLLERIGRKVSFFPWSNEDFTIDLDKFKEEVKKNKPDLLHFDHSTPMYSLPIKEIREIVGKDTPMIYDGSHVLGLIAGGQFQNPIEEGCDILIGSTHKSFPGPHKAVLMYADKALGEKVGDQVFEHAVSSQHLHHALAFYITALEMMAHGRSYAEQIVKNSHALSKALQAEGFKLVGRANEYSNSHIVGICGDFPDGHHKACLRLHECYISSNSKKMFGLDAIRLGVQEATRRGMKEKEMGQIASFFRRIIVDKEPNNLIAEEVIKFREKFNNVEFTLDDALM